MTKELVPIGRWGRLHEDYLKESFPDRLQLLSRQGILEEYLTQIDDKAQTRMEELVAAMCQEHGKTLQEYQPFQDDVSEGIRLLAEEEVLKQIVYE